MSKNVKLRTFHGPSERLDKIEEYHKHFGWKTEKKELKMLVMTYENNRPYNGALKRLEKQAEIINSPYPKRMIPWLIIAAIFLIPYFFSLGALDFNSIFAFISASWLRTLLAGIIPVVMLIVGCLNLFFAIYEVMVFFILKFTRKTTLEEIYKMADAFSGNVIDAPLEGNIEPDGPYTGILAKSNIGSAHRK